MIERPQVRIIQDQTEEISTREVSGWEAEQLLRKYSQDQSFSVKPITREEETIVNDLTFDEMIAKQEMELKEERLRKQHQMMSPKPVTFNGNNGYESEVRYGSDSDSGFGFKIEITTDMNLPKY